MTPDQLDSLKWVQDCGGSMRAVNNPHASWLISQGLVSKSLGRITLTPKGEAALPSSLWVPPPLSHSYSVTKWRSTSWDTLPTLFLHWILTLTNKAGPLIQITPEVPFDDPSSHVDDLDLVEFWCTLTAMCAKHKRVIYPAGTGGGHLLGDYDRQQMIQGHLPAVCVRDIPDVITNRIAGDLDLYLANNASQSAPLILARLWA